MQCPPYLVELIGQRVWAAPLGELCICVEIFSGWALIQDKEGRLLAVSVNDIEASPT